MKFDHCPECGTLLPASVVADMRKRDKNGNKTEPESCPRPARQAARATQ